MSQSFHSLLATIAGDLGRAYHEREVLEMDELARPEPVRPIDKQRRRVHKRLGLRTSTHRRGR